MERLIRVRAGLVACALLAIPGVAPAQATNACSTFAEMAIDTDGDGSPDCTEAREGTNPLIKDNDVFNNGRLFAEQLYRDFLGREGDEIGIAYWANEVNTGGHTRPEVIRIFVHTPEFEQRVAPVARLYFAYFLRWPDVAGLRYWIAAYHSGMSLDAIGAAFAESPEFTSRYAGLDNAGYVDQVYRNVLGRAPDPSGLAGWTSELDTGLLTRPQLMQRFVGSNEFVALSAHEVIVSMAYYGMLRREPDPSGFAFWVSYLDGGQPDLALLDGYFRSAEYHLRFF